MKVKKSRLESIRFILSTQVIGNQEELLNELAKEGFKLTQATLSRDLHQLRVVKTVTPDGRYRYVLTRSGHSRLEGPKESKGISMSEMGSNVFIDIKFSGNIAVIHTRPGYASATAYNIDNSDIPEILGTIAGDDTVMLVIAENVGRTAVLKALKAIFPDI